MVKTLQPSLDNGNPDSLARGWRRWVRARDAAYDKPHTAHAMLYFRRRALAASHSYLAVSLRRVTRWGDVTDYFLCSDYCAALQSQLYSGTLGSTRLLNDFKPIPSSTLSRTIACHVCRRKVKKTGETDDSLRINFYDPAQVITDVPRRTTWQERQARGPAKRPQPKAYHHIYYLTPEEKSAVDTLLNYIASEKQDAVDELLSNMSKNV